MDDRRRPVGPTDAAGPPELPAAAARACVGELVQIDGSEHAWFEDRWPGRTLPVYSEISA